MGCVAFMVIKVCHLSLSCLFVTLPLRKVTWECEMYTDRSGACCRYSFQFQHHSSSPTRWPGSILETGGTNIHQKWSLSSQNSQSNCAHQDISGEPWSRCPSAADSVLRSFGVLAKGHPLSGAISDHPVSILTLSTHSSSLVGSTH